MLGNKDVEFDVLNRLDDESLVAYCQVNHAANNVCNDDRYWKSRVESRINSPYVDLLKFKGNRKWHEYYIQDLSSIAMSRLNSFRAGREGRLDQVILYLSDKNIVPYSVDLDYNDLDDDYYVTYNVIRNVIEYASEYGHVDLVNYLLSLKVIDPRFLSQPSLVFAAKNGHLEIVKLLDNYGVNIHGGTLPDHALYLAHRNNRTAVVEYLLSRGANPANIF